ncbi:hypothetical protein P170DRAFT_218049 [Aspergillus steynii IBT 23096]|uniref:DUF7730 domain-containing protein n=1 Tax=Aspergillus steynii IBT 23096 TaxID=1392250 RepID=A0A2I2G172_9EURO|nr:uncharacterized protein P170DRAFT_218049 [Aspergillus steynii IBT 23096]PLB46619.1 hypothetical protein P170DRAFT_218049 [Aspergillus steynii IBT 23096]
MKLCGPIAPYDLGTWHEGCRALARMVGLEELSIHIGGYSLCAWEMFSTVAEPLRNIQVSRLFEVLLPWDDEVQGYVIHGMPFKLRGASDQDCC